MKRWVILLLSVLLSLPLPAQDLRYFKKVVKELSSARYQGRGYARGGANKAGKYLAREYRKAGVDEVTLQPFTIDINTFCGAMAMQADGKVMWTFGVIDFAPKDEVGHFG